MTAVTHVAAPDRRQLVAWCRSVVTQQREEDGIAHNAAYVDHDVRVTRTGVVSCGDCIALLCDKPQYYNLLRCEGLRTFEEEPLG